jgi:hypothetical protein
MARNLSSGALGQILSSHVRLVFFVQANFASGPVYVWNGLGNLAWNSQTWTGLGSLLSISAVSEATDLSAKSITLSLSGIPSDLLSDCLTEVRQSNTVQLWLGFLDSTGNVIASPYMPFSGHMDVPTINEGQVTSTIDLTCENPLVDMNRAPNRRFTNDDQLIDYPTDSGFIWVAAIQTWQGVWGQAGPGAVLIRPGGSGANAGNPSGGTGNPGGGAGGRGPRGGANGA